jgi:hypothetical protein
VVASQCTTPEMAEPPVIDWLIVLCGGRPPIVIPVCVVETMAGAAMAAPTPSATATAATPKVSDVDLRNAGGVPLDSGVRSRHRLPPRSG